MSVVCPSWVRETDRLLRGLWEEEGEQDGEVEVRKRLAAEKQIWAYQRTAKIICYINFCAHAFTPVQMHTVVPKDRHNHKGRQILTEFRVLY